MSALDNFILNVTTFTSNRPREQCCVQKCICRDAYYKDSGCESSHSLQHSFFIFLSQEVELFVLEGQTQSDMTTAPLPKVETAHPAVYARKRWIVWAAAVKSILDQQAGNLCAVKGSI